MTRQVEYITVRSGRSDDKVVLWEKHPDHPEDAAGQTEAFVAGNLVVRVARTPEVNIRLRNGDLVEVDDEPTPQADPELVRPEATEPEEKREVTSAAQLEEIKASEDMQKRGSVTTST